MKTADYNFRVTVLSSSNFILCMTNW